MELLPGLEQVCCLRLTRQAGSWDRVEADLRAAVDSDPQLASLGVTGIQNWLMTSAATTWAVVPDTQRERLRALLETGALNESRTRAVAFHARIRLQSTTRVVDDSRVVKDVAVNPRPSRVRRWLRRPARAEPDRFSGDECP